MTLDEMLVTYCTPYGAPQPIPGGVRQWYACPPNIAPFLPPLPEDVEIPGIEIPGISLPGSDDGPNITDDPEEGVTVGPVIPPAETDTTVADPEPGSLAGELDGPAMPPDLNQPHPDVKQEIQERADDDQCVEGCEECAPRADGNAAWTSYAPDDAEFVGESAWNGYHYQHDVCGLPYDPPTSNIMEWKFASYSWDGFESGSCTMLEAKYGYNTRLTHTYVSHITDDGRETSRYRTIAQEGWESRARATFGRLVSQARRQIGYLRPYTPQVGLLWSFSSPDSLAYFNNTGGNRLVAEWRYIAMHIPPSRIY